MSVIAGTSYLIVPLLVLAVVGLLAILLRWTYGTARTAPPARPVVLDFGLLRPLTTIDDPDEARALRAALAESGIRSTTSRVNGRTIVLVFHGDVDRARQVLGPH